MIRERTPRDAKDRRCCLVSSFAFLGVPSRIILSFRRRRGLGAVGEVWRIIPAAAKAGGPAGKAGDFAGYLVDNGKINGRVFAGKLDDRA